MKYPRMLIAMLIGLAFAAPAFAATAYWTGRQEQVQTVTGQFVWKCEYNYNGQMVYELFQTSCPSSVEIQ